MDVAESDWVSAAIDNVDRYLHRGGRCKGDEPQLLGGTNLLNTIGVAMGLPLRDPGSWSERELKRAMENQLVYFDGEARKTIDVIANQIRNCCDGDDENFVTVLPIELYFKGKLYEIPLFRVHRYKDSPRQYVDNIGRNYKSFDDWFETCKLPPCKMAYPTDLQLAIRPGYDYSRVKVGDTPFAREEFKAVRSIDTISAVAGISSGVGLMFASGGLALPFVVTGLASAIWGTARATERLADKSEHGESINPFTDPESKTLWLGIGANVGNFVAMGASMYLSSLAMKGQNISNAFSSFVDLTNGVNFAISSTAIMESTMVLCKNYDELSRVDILLHIAAVAFWTKGLFTYKDSGAIIKDAQDLAFKHINSEIGPERSTALIELRRQFNNDAVLLREFHGASKSGVSVVQFSQIITDANSRGRVQFDGAGNLLLPGGQKYSITFLQQLSPEVRQSYFHTINSLSPDQIEVFESFRNRVNDDMNLIAGLNRVAVEYKVNAREATEGVIRFWQTFTKVDMPRGMNVKIADGALLLGSAPPIKVQQLPQMTAPMTYFISEHLSRLDNAASGQWTSSITVLLDLQSNGLFSNCPVTDIVTSGRAVLSLNNHLQISIYKLKTINAEECREILKLVNGLPQNISNAKLPVDVMKLCVQKQRLRFQCQRIDSLQWMTNSVTNEKALRRLLEAKLQSHELDRLYTFKSTVDTFKAAPYMGDMMAFVVKRGPKSVSEMVAYSEFVVKFVETEKIIVEKKLRDGTLVLPINVKKAEWTRNKAREVVFQNTAVMHSKLDELVTMVTRQEMVGTEFVAKNLSDEDLVKALQRADLKFGSKASAAYHVFKHPTDPLEAYIVRANETVRSAEKYSVTLTQEGTSRTVRFEGAGGSCIVLESDGRVLLCTFSPKHS